MAIHCVEAELSVVQLWHKPAERHPELAAITGVFIFLGTGDIERSLSLPLWEIYTIKDQPVGATTRRHVSSGEERTAVIRNSAMPLELVEGFHAQVFSQALGNVQHLDRQQTFLQLGAGTAESGGIDGVDCVDTVLDEDTSNQADRLTAQTDVARVIAKGVVVINERVQQLDTRAFLQRMTAGIIDIVEILAAVFGFKVVPVIATNEGTRVPVA